MIADDLNKVSGHDNMIRENDDSFDMPNEGADNAAVSSHPVDVFTEADLVSFGEYLLSEERSDRILSAPVGDSSTSLGQRIRLRSVYHADIENWKAKK